MMLAGSYFSNQGLNQGLGTCAKFQPLDPQGIPSIYFTPPQPYLSAGAGRLRAAAPGRSPQSRARSPCTQSPAGFPWSRRLNPEYSRGIFPTRGSNLGLLHCRKILYHLSCLGSPFLLSCILLFVTPWTRAHQAPLSMEFSRQEYWSGVPFPFPGNLPNPGIKPGSP